MTNLDDRIPGMRSGWMSLTDSGKVLYKLKKKFRDGSTHVVLDPLDWSIF